jgi:uncharacterized protein
MIILAKPKQPVCPILGNLLLVLSLFLSGCATYQGKVDNARNLLASNKPQEAADYLKPLAEKDDGDQLIYIYDYATALQATGNFKESNKWYEVAYKMGEAKDYTSLSRQAGSLLLSEEMVQYRGEDFEKLFVHVMLALNYLAQNDLEGANVETRRLVDRLNYYRIEEKKPYEQNPFAFYLNGHIWEANRQWDSAYIDFEKAYNLNPKLEAVQEDLVRTAYKSRRMEQFEKWSKKFNIPKRKEWESSKNGELVVFYLQGFGPRKQPRPDSPRFPMLVPVSNMTKMADIEVSKDNIPFGKIRTEMAYNVQDVAIKTLNDQYAKLVAKRIAGMVAKDVAAKRIAKENEALGLVAFIAMHASDRADLRQWSTLPQSIQVARYYLPVGEYKVTAKGLNSLEAPTGENSEEIPVEIRGGRKSFVIWRSWK